MKGSTRIPLPIGALAALALLGLFLAVPGPAAAGATQSMAVPPERARAIALADLTLQAPGAGLAAGDVADVAVTDLVPTRHNGATHVYLRQRVNGLEIDGAEMGIHVDRSGRVFHRTGSFVADAAARAGEVPGFPLLGPDEAVASAAGQLGLPPVEGLDLVETRGGIERAATFANPAVSESDIPVRLRYLRLPDSDQLRLAWNLVIDDPRSEDYWDLWVDAESGALVRRVNWTAHATYRVFASPMESPDDGPRTDEVDPHDLAASPYGWHDLNGVAGPETTLTSGNNANACVDADANNVCDAGSQPDGGPMLIFQPPIDLATQEPNEYRDAAVVNLYYWNNIVHDVLYQYGFDEPGGNFQENNYGNGGLGSDSVDAQAQDGSGTNNANFSTPPDGANPRMQMFVWTYPITHEVFVNATNYPASPTSGIAGGWGANPPDQTGLTGALILANDGAGTSPTDACEPLIGGPYTDKVVIIDRGSCEFGAKALRAQQAGADGVIIVNNAGDGLLLMGPGASGAQVTIAVLFVGQTNGTTIKGLVPMPATLRAKDPSTFPPSRDSDLDAGVIAHEYGHGLSNRLTGGPATTSCLGNQEQMGEGWSDWMTLFMHAQPSETATTPRPIGTYVGFEDPLTGAGIRRFPYNTDNTANPLTYGDIGGEAVPHGVGAVWANMLWEMYWNLVGIYGYDPDIYAGSGGNNVAFQLTVDGMKLQPCSPGFVTGRNAILAGDQASNDGDNECAIWTAFAERGVGATASQGSSAVVGDEVENFDLPAQCVDLIFANSFGPRWQDLWSSNVP